MSHPTFRGTSFNVAQIHRFSESPSKLVIGIDLATTRCCLATGQRLLGANHNHTVPDVKLYSCWTASYEAGSKWPITAMLYDSQGLPKTGNDLEIAFKNPKAKRFDMNKHFREWKLLFHDNQSDPTTKKIQDQLYQKLESLDKTRLELLQDWVRVIYNELLIAQDAGLYSLNKSTGLFDKNDIEIVVTVPPGRSVLAHDEVHEAFIQEPIGKGQVFLVSEPEAMFRSWIHDGADPQEFRVGGRYMVADGGGGTCCLVRFRLDRLKPSLGFEQEFESESIVSGAESISDLVEEKIGRQVAHDYPNRAWVLDQFRRQFDEWYKSRFGEDDIDDTYVFQLPALEIELSRQEIADCFDTCITKVLKAMDRQLCRGLPVDFLVLGGGLFASPYVMRAVKRHFLNMKICPLSADKGHVARGAVLVRACAPFIVKRPILRSKAITTFFEVTDEIRKSPIYPNLCIQEDIYERKEWYLAAQWLAKQGTEAKVKQADDLYEVASEASFGYARRRYFDIDTPDLGFSETILTFNHSPPAEERHVVQLKDGSWISVNEDSIPQPESSEELTWDPKKIGVNITTLEISSPANCKSFRILRYSIQMQMREVGTTYWIKTWSWTKPAKTKGRVQQILLSEAHERQALFNSREISQNLAVSYDLGPGTRKMPTGDGHMETVRRHYEVLHPHQQQGSPKELPTPGPAPNKGSQTNHAANRRRLAATAMTHTFHSQDRELSDSPLRTARPTKRQSMEGNAEYSVGAPRNNGGCWTCSFRNVKCEKGAPECTECSNLGLVCEYGRPVWLYDDNLREEQKIINRRLIKEHKAMFASRRQAGETPGRVSPAKPVSHSSQAPRLGNISSAPAQASNPDYASAANPLKMVRRKAYAPKAKTPLRPAKSAYVPDEYDIYDVTPPPQKRVRIFTNPLVNPSIELGDEEEEEVMGDPDHWIRRSTRQREPVTPAADTVIWDDINEVFDVASLTAEPE